MIDCIQKQHIGGSLLLINFIAVIMVKYVWGRIGAFGTILMEQDLNILID